MIAMREDLAMKRMTLECVQSYSSGLDEILVQHGDQFWMDE